MDFWRRWLTLVLALLNASGLSAAVSSPAQGADLPQFRVSELWKLGGDGGWDYLTVDQQAQVLYVARATRVAVVDLHSGRSITEIPDTPGVHGIALAPELNRGFISCGRANLVKVFDLRTRRVIASIDTGDGPDAILYDPSTQRVFVLNGRGHSSTVIDAHDDRVVATIALGGKPEEGAADGAGEVFVNIEDRAELVRLDAHTATLTARWPLHQCEEPSGLALDVRNRRGFSMCGNARLAVTNLDSGMPVANLPIGAHVDGGAYDPLLQAVFSSNGEGSVSIIRQLSPDRYEVAQTLQTAPGARTMALDPVTHRLYLPTSQLGPPAAGASEHRPTIIPGSFEIIVAQPP